MSCNCLSSAGYAMQRNVLLMVIALVIFYDSFMIPKDGLWQGCLSLYGNSTSLLLANVRLTDTATASCCLWSCLPPYSVPRKSDVSF